MNNSTTYKKWIFAEHNGFMCWQKKFEQGLVYMFPDCATVVFSYGPNSGGSYSSTRWNYDRPERTLEEAMDAVDRGHGKKMIFVSNVLTEKEREEFMAKSLAAQKASAILATTPKG